MEARVRREEARAAVAEPAVVDVVDARDFVVTGGALTRVEVVEESEVRLEVRVVVVVVG